MTGAWAQLVGLVDDLELLNAALVEVQEETLRRAAGTQRHWLAAQGYDSSCVCEGCSWCLAQEYINLIDPDRE